MFCEHALRIREDCSRNSIPLIFSNTFSRLKVQQKLSLCLEAIDREASLGKYKTKTIKQLLLSATKWWKC